MESSIKEYDEDTIYTIKLSDIFADEEFNCRGHIAANQVDELANNIARQGLDQPITIEPYGKNGFEWRILAGHRRHKACELLRASDEVAPNMPLGTIRCVVRTGLDELGKLALNFTENTQRQDLNIKQESKAIESFVRLGQSRNQIAEVVGKSGGWVQVRMYFGLFPEKVQDILIERNVKQGEIREFYKTLQDCPDGNINMFLEQVRKYKETGSLKAGKSSARVKDEKRQRNKSEINAMMKHIRQNGMGSGILTRLLAWCTGAISEGELDKDLEDFHDDYSFNYERLHDDGN